MYLIVSIYTIFTYKFGGSQNIGNLRKNLAFIMGLKQPLLRKVDFEYQIVK